MSGKIVLAAMLGFISGAAAGAAITYILSYKKIEAEQVERTNKEIEEARKETIQYVLKRHGYSEPKKNSDEAKEDVPEEVEVEEAEVPDRTSYSKIFSSSRPVHRPLNAELITNENELDMSRSKEPIILDDYEALVAITPRGESKIYDWIFYENFRSGLMVDNESDQVINFPLLLHMSSKELKKLYSSKDTELYIYLPDDGIGVRIYIEPSVSPNLLEYDIPPQLYPSPSEDDDEEDDDEEDDDEYEYDDDPEWGD